MQIELWSLGKESSKLLEAGIEEYTKRINRYHSFKLVYIDNTKVPKNLPKEQLMDKEAELIFDKLGEKDLLISLDERGKQFTSVNFAKKMENMMNLSPSKIIFVLSTQVLSVLMFAVFMFTMLIYVTKVKQQSL
jgi:23S rRNA (pseudouridine1915-N3)-methyltransferase